MGGIPAEGEALHPGALDRMRGKQAAKDLVGPQGRVHGPPSQQPLVPSPAVCPAQGLSALGHS